MTTKINLCKLATRATEIDTESSEDRCFKDSNGTWKVIEALKSSDFDTILMHLHKSGLKTVVSEDGESLFVASTANQLKNRYESQAYLFEFIFENYQLSEDFCVFVNTMQWNQRKQIKDHVTNKFYDALLMEHQKHQSDKAVATFDLPESFLPTLCQYQIRTVDWLLQRELNPGKMRVYYKRLQAKDGITCVYKNLLEAEFYNKAPEDIILPPGGILADEMGLGKTVELLALLLLNKRQLAVYKVPQSFAINDENEPPAKKVRPETEVHCLCGVSAKKRKLVQCKKCNSFQHAGCVSKNDSDHSNEINEPYFCSVCWKDLSEISLVPSRATLIVTPSTIRLQWLNEIRRHISSHLRVYNYEGSTSKNWISPRQLADYDVVLTDYTILRREVYYTSATQDTGRSMRHKRRCLRNYTPILMIQWWRCCLDEAQMTESAVSQMADLVRSIPAINRWAVSGTPIQRSIDDLFPLVRFIGLENYINSYVWQTLVKDFMHNCDDTKMDLSSLRLVEIFGNFMWRTGKQQVKDELPIPPQTEKIHFIALSDLEFLYYTEQHKECKQNFEEVLGKYFESSQLVVSTSQHLMNIIMKPLLRIRMCCTIPTITAPRNQHAITGIIQKQFLQPKELHAHLLTRNEKECKNHLRSICSAYNGLAALDFIKGKHMEAVDNYRAVLKLAIEYTAEKNISVDSLLQIHALYNILQARNISPALEAEISKHTFEQYENQLNDLEWKYLEAYASQLCRVNQAFDKAKTTLQANTENTELDFMSFLSMLLDIDDSNMQTQLLSKILEECIRKFGNLRLEAASSLRGVLYIINTWFNKLEKVQAKIFEAFDELLFFTSNIKPRSQLSLQTWRDVNKFINDVCDCHLIELRELENERDNETNESSQAHKIDRNRRKHVGKHLCKLCKLIDMINNYECLLFKKSIDITTNIVEGDESPQLEVEMIKIIFSFLKPKRSKMSVDIEKHYEVLKNMQSFCKNAIKFWIEIEFTVKAYDELDMCKMRTTLTEDPEERNNYKIMSNELDLNYVRQKHNLNYAQHCFDLKFARLKYIKHLEADKEVGTCPICHSDEEKRHAFLVCGHQICWSCYKFLTRINHGNRLTCSLCRNEQPTESVFFMTSNNKVNLPNQGESIKGDYSAKLTYIVQLLKQLICEHKQNMPPPADTIDDMQNINVNDIFPLKILIFSQWTFVLSALAAALHENDITFCQSSSVRSIETFRNPDSGITCLLMPLHKGCKGLNLIEATHVFLIEPVLNPSEELQAIGRVHRFGQTRPTTVHRFIVEETVEENIHKLVSAGRNAAQDWHFDSMTFENLRDLFTQIRN